MKDLFYYIIHHLERSNPEEKIW